MGDEAWMGRMSGDGAKGTSRVQGASAGTIIKEHSLDSVLRVLLSITKKRPGPFLYADLNAGSGINVVNGQTIPGSPIVALKAIRESGHPMVEPWFVDHNPGAVLELLSRVGPGERVRCMDNGVFLENWGDQIARRIPNARHNARGLVFADPNGADSDLPMTHLTIFARRFHRMDLCINLNKRWLDLAWGCRRHGRVGWSPEEKMLLNPVNLPQLLNRDFGWVQRRYVGSARFVMFLLMNYELRNGHARLGWHKIDSDEGKRILQEVDYEQRTNSEVDE